MKVASLVTGVLSLIFCFVPVLGLILGMVAIYTARVSNGNSTYDGMAVAGLICGIVGLCLGVVALGVTGCTVSALG